MSQRIADDPGKGGASILPPALGTGHVLFGIFGWIGDAFRETRFSPRQDALQGWYLQMYANALGKGEVTLAYPYMSVTTGLSEMQRTSSSIAGLQPVPTQSS
jgi:hypothetical protein